MTNEATIQAVFQDEAFVRGLFEMETPQEVQSALRGRGVEMTVDEIVKLRDGMVKHQAGGPLSDSELESVAGGGDSFWSQLDNFFDQAWYSISMKW